MLKRPDVVDWNMGVVDTRSGPLPAHGGKLSILLLLYIVGFFVEVLLTVSLTLRHI